MILIQKSEALVFVALETDSSCFRFQKTIEKSLAGAYSCVELFHLALVFSSCMTLISYVMSNAGDHWRVDGLVSVARAFGDKTLKEHMTARPDLADLVVDLSCEFLILGSNGLWTVFTNQEVVDIVHKTKDPMNAAQELVCEARNRYSEDDISCAVIQFKEL